MKIFVEVKDKRHWRFYMELDPADQALTPNIEPKHWFLRKLEEVYETTRRAIEHADNRIVLRLRQVIRYLESRIDPNESLMKRLRKAEVVEIIYPAPFKESLVRRRFLRFIRRQSRHHQRWMIINFLLLPVTGAMMLLPGPNVFFGWNAFRLISHYLAREGGQRVKAERCQLRFVPKSAVGDQWSVVSSQMPDVTDH
jgi:hypothetical protein